MDDLIEAFCICFYFKLKMSQHLICLPNEPYVVSSFLTHSKINGGVVFCCFCMQYYGKSRTLNIRRRRFLTVSKVEILVSMK